MRLISRCLSPNGMFCGVCPAPHCIFILLSLLYSFLSKSHFRPLQRHSTGGWVAQSWSWEGFCVAATHWWQSLKAAGFEWKYAPLKAVSDQCSAKAAGIQWFWKSGLICFPCVVIVTYQWSSSRSGPRLPASSCVASIPARHCVSGLPAHWPGRGGRWHRAGSRTRSLDRNLSPSRSPLAYAVPAKKNQALLKAQGRKDQTI